MKKFKEAFNNIDKEILKISNTGIKYSFIITITSIALLFIYTHFYSSSLNLYYIGISLLKFSFTCIATFIIGAILFDRIKKDLYF